MFVQHSMKLCRSINVGIEYVNISYIYIFVKVDFSTMFKEYDLGKPTYKNHTSWPKIMRMAKNGILAVDVKYVLDTSSCLS